MMNGYQRAKSLGLTGTPEEIVEQVKSISLHHRNVYITGGPADTESVNLLHLLTARHGVMTMGSNQQWQGSLIDLETTNPTVSHIMSLVRPHLQVNDTLVFCAASSEAADMLNALTEIVGQLTGKSAQVLVEVSLLSGGRIGADYDDFTPEQYITQKAEDEAEQAEAELQAELQAKKDAWQQRFDAALNTIGTVEQADGIADVVAISQEMAE
jgi:organic radical activating enzyme